VGKILPHVYPLHMPHANISGSNPTLMSFNFKNPNGLAQLSRMNHFKVVFMVRYLALVWLRFELNLVPLGYHSLLWLAVELPSSGFFGRGGDPMRFSLVCVSVWLHG
jgi:hypothetical protein